MTDQTMTQKMVIPRHNMHCSLDSQSSCGRDSGKQCHLSGWSSCWGLRLLIWQQLQSTLAHDLSMQLVQYQSPLRLQSGVCRL